MFGTGGAGLRDICCWVRVEVEVRLVGGIWRMGRLGKECVDVLEDVRVRFGESLLPSTPRGAAGLYGGTISFLAIGLPCFRLAAELAIELGVLVPLKSTVCALEVPLAGGGSGLLPTLFTSTQSGSGDGVNGLLGRLWFGRWSFEGGCTLDRAGRPSEYQYKS